MKNPFVFAGAALLAAALPLSACASTPEAAPASTTTEKKPEGSCGGEKKPEGSCGEGSCGGAPK